MLWIGDAKYKRLPPGAYQNADLYQLLAYATATGLTNGTLFYAADAGVSSGEYIVRNAGKFLRAISIDLAAPPAAIRRRIATIADQIHLSMAGPASSVSSPSSRAVIPHERPQIAVRADYAPASRSTARR